MLLSVICARISRCAYCKRSIQNFNLHNFVCVSIIICPRQTCLSPVDACCGRLCFLCRRCPLILACFICVIFQCNICIFNYIAGRSFCYRLQSIVCTISYGYRCHFNLRFVIFNDLEFYLSGVAANCNSNSCLTNICIIGILNRISILQDSIALLYYNLRFNFLSGIGLVKNCVYRIGSCLVNILYPLCIKCYRDFRNSSLICISIATAICFRIPACKFIALSFKRIFCKVGRYNLTVCNCRFLVLHFACTAVCIKRNYIFCIQICNAIALPCCLLNKILIHKAGSLYLYTAFGSIFRICNRIGNCILIIRFKYKFIHVL